MWINKKIDLIRSIDKLRLVSLNFLAEDYVYMVYKRTVTNHIQIIEFLFLH